MTSNLDAGVEAAESSVSLQKVQTDTALLLVSTEGKVIPAPEYKVEETTLAVSIAVISR